jgi:hypothetical protein
MKSVKADASPKAKYMIVSLVPTVKCPVLLASKDITAKNLATCCSKGSLEATIAGVVEIAKDRTQRKSQERANSHTNLDSERRSVMAWRTSCTAPMKVFLQISKPDAWERKSLWFVVCKFAWPRVPDEIPDIAEATDLMSSSMAGSNRCSRFRGEKLSLGAQAISLGAIARMPPST